MLAGRFCIVALCAVCAMAEDSVFERVGEAPLVPCDPAVAWRAVSTANASLVPADGQMHLYLRGTTRDAAGVEHDHIGLFTQRVEDFRPEGPWREHAANPVIPIGPEGAHDAGAVLDTAAVRTPDGLVYCYYSARDVKHDYSIGGAVSGDGGVSFRKFAANPLVRHVGVGDVVHHEGRFYLYFVSAQWDAEARVNRDRLRVWVVSSEDPERFDFASATVALSPGENAWDMFSIGGARVFRLADRWWMVYQGSDTHWDFPYRFHAAWSSDLLRWNKVCSDRPLFTRGEAGTWDQGAIWQGEVLPWEGKLYLFYEGWGSEEMTHLRNRPYYPGGCSQLGLAVCDQRDFLQWAGVGER